MLVRTATTGVSALTALRVIVYHMGHHQTWLLSQKTSEINRNCVPFGIFTSCFSIFFTEPLYISAFMLQVIILKLQTENIRYADIK